MAGYKRVHPEVGQKYRIKKEGIRSWAGFVSDDEYPAGHIAEVLECRAGDWALRGRSTGTDWCIHKDCLTTEYLELVEESATEKWCRLFEEQMTQDFQCQYMGMDFGEEITKPKKPIMTTITNMAKKLLDGDTQTLIKAGYLDSELELTSKGRSELEAIQFQAYKAELVALAKAELEEKK